MTDETAILRLPVSAPESGNYVLHYNPERAAFTGGSAASADKYFSEFVWLIFIWLVVMALFFSSGFGNILTSLLLSSPLMLLFLMDLSRPTSVEVNASGFRIHWLHRYCFYSSPWIGWDRVSMVRTTESYIPGMNAAKCYELSVEHSRRNFWFEIMSVPITAKVEGKTQTFRLIESGFFQEDDLATFTHALRTYVPSDRVSAEIHAAEQLGEVPSYTALWLDSLQGNRNTTESTLPDGTMLADGRYFVINRLGAGGQAVVYAAMDRGPGTSSEYAEPVACVLKEFVLPVRGGHEIKKRAVQNIQREANLLMSFNHGSIVGFKDLFIEGSRAYLVMERIFGETLRRKVEKTGKLSVEQAVDLAVQMCYLLEFLHGSDPPVIHRDFTPENLMLTEDGQLKLIDFNVAHRLESSSTRTVVGKHAYVPPEQFRGKPTAQSDIYALGATMYFLLTGEDPEPISCSDLSGDESVPPLLAQIVRKATEPNTADRFRTAGELKASLKAALL